jgi:hypothetical protein
MAMEKAIAHDPHNIGMTISQRSGEKVWIHFCSLAVGLVHQVFVVAAKCGRLTGLSKLL